MSCKMEGKMTAFIRIMLLMIISEHFSKSMGLTYDKCNDGLFMRNLTGEVLLAGLFPLTYFNSKEEEFVRNNVAITWVEAFTYAIKKINDDANILPEIHVGYDIRNSCNKESIALQNVLDFMLDLSVIQSKNEIMDSRCGCGNTRNRIIAVIGGASSSISTSVSNVLSDDGIPQISYSSTSVTLSNKINYPNFLRTLPSDIYQAKAMVALLREFQWTYINVLASDDDYGRLGFYELEKELKQAGMCLAEFKVFKKILNIERIDEIISKIRKGLSKKANVVILWCQINEAKIIMEESWNHGLRGITWIGSETLGNNVDLFELGDIVKGFIGLKPTLNKVPSFESYLNNLKPASTVENPWIKQYWESIGNCGIKTSFNTSSVENTTILSACKNGGQLPRSKYSHVISSVYAVLLALDNLTRNMNGSVHEKLSLMKHRDLYNEILNIKYHDTNSALHIEFDENGDSKFASYTFTTVVGNNDSLEFVDFGSWEGETGLITIDNIHFVGNASVISQCSAPCTAGMFQIPGDVACCWTCVACKLDSITTNGNETFCKQCKGTSISNANKTKCLPLTELYFTKESILFKVTISASSFAIVCVTFVAILFAKCWNTPVIKSANRELSLVQLIMLFVALWYPVSYWMTPSTFQCILQCVWLAFCPTIILSVTLVKTYRLFRIFNKKTTEDSRILHNKYQSLVVFFFLFLQTSLAVTWSQYYNMSIIKTIDRIENSFVQSCCENSGILLVVLQCYNLVISLACAFMAFRARNLPNAFNEARYITFGTFTYCITWMFAIPLFISISASEKNQVVCVTNTISNFALFLCFFANKVRVILFIPKKNTKHYFTRQATIDQFARTRTNSYVTSSLPSLQGVESPVGSYSDVTMDQRHWSIASLSSLSSSDKKSAGICHPRNPRRCAQTPMDILRAKYERGRSQTIH